MRQHGTARQSHTLFPAVTTRNTTQHTQHNITHNTQHTTQQDAQLSLSQLRACYRELLRLMWVLWSKARLVHADLSEYNILVHQVRAPVRMEYNMLLLYSTAVCCSHAVLFLLQPCSMVSLMNTIWFCIQLLCTWFPLLYTLPPPYTYPYLYRYTYTYPLPLPLHTRTHTGHIVHY